MDFYNKVNEIHSFVVLREFFESWVKDGSINEKSLELIFGYTFLIAYPSIYLKKENAEQEIAAAKVCHEIMMKYAKDTIKERLSSDDEKTAVATALLALPPEKYILTVCSEFFHLHNLLKGLYANYTDEQFAMINGDDYAKAWLNIFDKGYHFRPIKEELDADFNHFNEALLIISKMKLSPEFKEKMNVESIKPQLKNYYHDGEGNNGGTGCLVSIVMFIVSSLTMVCYML